MKRIKVISTVIGIFIVVSMLIAFGISGSKAADNSASKQETAKSGASAGGNAMASVAPSDGGRPAGGGAPGVGPSRDLSDSYVIDILAPENAPDKTIYIKDPKGKISATWDSEHGHQVLTNVSFDGEVLSFNALSGTPGTEYFYFRLECYGDYLLGYAKTQEGSKSPVLAKAVK